jgi:hypothetical protein
LKCSGRMRVPGMPCETRDTVTVVEFLEGESEGPHDWETEDPIGDVMSDHPARRSSPCAGCGRPGFGGTPGTFCAWRVPRCRVGGLRGRDSVGGHAVEDNRRRLRPRLGVIGLTSMGVKAGGQSRLRGRTDKTRKPRRMPSSSNARTGGTQHVGVEQTPSARSQRSTQLGLHAFESHREIVAAAAEWSVRGSLQPTTPLRRSTAVIPSAGPFPRRVPGYRR